MLDASRGGGGAKGGGGGGGGALLDDADARRFPVAVLCLDEQFRKTALEVLSLRVVTGTKVQILVQKYKC